MWERRRYFREWMTRELIRCFFRTPIAPFLHTFFLFQTFFPPTLQPPPLPSLHHFYHLHCAATSSLSWPPSSSPPKPSPPFPSSSPSPSSPSLPLSSASASSPHYNHLHHHHLHHHLLHHHLHHHHFHCHQLQHHHPIIITFTTITSITTFSTITSITITSTVISYTIITSTMAKTFNFYFTPSLFTPLLLLHQPQLSTYLLFTSCALLWETDFINTYNLSVGWGLNHVFSSTVWKRSNFFLNSYEWSRIPIFVTSGF